MMKLRLVRTKRMEKLCHLRYKLEMKPTITRDESPCQQGAH